MTMLPGNMMVINNIARKYRGSTASAIANIGMLCARGIAPRKIMPTITKLINSVIEPDIIGIFWSLGNAKTIDMFIAEPNIITPDMFDIYRQQDFYRPAAYTYKQKNFLPDHENESNVFEFFGQSDIFDSNYVNINSIHFFDHISHDQHNPHGCIVVVKEKCDVAMSHIDRNMIEDMLQLIILGFLVEPNFEIDTISAPIGFISTNVNLDITYVSDEIYVIFWMIARDHMNNYEIIAASENHDFNFYWTFDHFCKTNIKLIPEGGCLTQSIASSWGDIKFSYNRNDSNIVVIKIEQKLNFSCYLAEKFCEIDLSPRKLMIYWLIVEGMSRKQIAWALSISLDTVNEHISQIFDLMGAANSLELVRKLIGDSHTASFRSE